MSDTVKEKDPETQSDTEKMSDKNSVRKAFEEKHSSKISKENSKEPASTYLNIVDDEEGKMLEMDLVFIRQRGIDEKFLEITLTEVDEVNGQSVPLRKVKEIKTKEEFNKIKDYFVNLSWD